MSNAETDLLRESIDRLTHDERPPSGLADQAFRRHRQRTIALRAAAAGTAVVAAGVLATAALPGAAPRPGQPGRLTEAGTAQTPEAQTPGAQTPAAQTPAAPAPAVQTAAYVSGHTERALAVAAGGNLVEEIHTVGQNYPLGLTQVLSFPVNGGGTGHLVKQAGPTASQENTWSYRGQLREQGLDATGQPVFDATSTTTRSLAGARTVMTVSGTGADYTSRTWWRSSLQLSLPAAAGPAKACASAFLPPPVGTTLDWAAAIRTALSCGHFQLAGHEQVGSVNAIKLVSAKVNGPYTATVWVDPSTYLPVRLTWNWLDPRAQGPGTLTGDFRWVQPTQASLGALQVKIPDGFRPVQAGGLPVPGINL
jgi:hypothetical protein